LSAAAEAKAAGYGGIAAAARATKVARSTIGRGLKDLRDPGSLTGKVRRKGGGSPRLTTRDPTLLEDLQRLLEPATMGDPMRPLRWVSKSHDKLARALRAMGHKVSSSTIPKLLEELKYCRHFNRKTKEGGKHPDRDAQFEYINAKAEAFQAADQPVISIDSKKKELLGANRQNVQRIVNDLAKEGLVALEANPHHRRAQLVVLTERGKRTFDAAMRLQAPWVNGLSVGLAVRDIETTGAVAKALRRKLEDDQDAGEQT
jgi:hypothetical protein